jgi:hypothetical protein
MATPDASPGASPDDSSRAASHAAGSATAGRGAGTGGGRRAPRRWPWIAGGALAFLLVLVLLAPTLLAPAVKERVLGLANERLDGTATLQGLSFSLGGRVHVAGLSVRDAEDRPVADLPEVEIQADVLALLGGRVVADVTVRDPVLHVRRRADGRLNVQALLRDGPPARERVSVPEPVASAVGGRLDGAEARGGEARGRDGAPDAGAPLAVADLPAIEGRLTVSRGTLLLHDEEHGTTELRELEAALDVEDLERPAPFRVSAALAGPGGPAGRVRCTGDVTAARDGLVDPARMRAHAEYALEDVRLDGLQPAVALFAPVEQLGGGLAGRGSWTWDGGLAVAGSTEFDLSGPAIRTAALGPEPRALPTCRLTVEASLDDAGDGTQSLRFVAGPLLDLRYDGTVRGATGESPALDGTLELSGRIDELQALARGLVPLREDVALAGSLSAHARLGAAFGEDGLASASVDARVGVDGLQAHEVGGGKVNLGELTGLDLVLQGRAEPAAGRLELEAFELTAGPVGARASASVSGLPHGGAAFDPAAMVVREGDLQADADLGRLADVLGRFVDLGGATLAGRLAARATADGREGGASVRFDVAINGLHATTPGGDRDDGGVADDGDGGDGGGDGADGPGTELRIPRLAVAGRLGADAQAARVEELSVHWDALTAAGLAVPAGDLGLSGRYAVQKGMLELDEWTLESPLARGGGRARIEGLASTDAGPVLSGQVSLQGETEPWRALLAGLVPDLGPARASGTFALDVQAGHEGTMSTIESTLTLTGVALDGFVAGGRPLALPPTNLNLGSRIELDTGGEGRLSVPTLAMNAPGLTVTAKAEVLGTAADAADRQVRLSGFWNADPGELGRRLAILMDGIEPSGERLDGNVSVAMAGERVDVQARVTGAHLLVELPPDEAGGTPARRVEQREVDVRFDGTVDLGADDRLEIRAASFSSGTATASLAGTVTGLSTPSEQAADVSLDASASLDRLLADLGALLPLPGWAAEGALTLTGSVSGDAGRLALGTRAEIADLHVVVPLADGAPPDAVPTVIADEMVAIDVHAALDVEPLDLQLDHVDVRSSVLHGRLTGRATGLRALLAADVPAQPGPAAGAAAEAGGEAPVARFAPLDGDFRYVPSRLGALLSPWLPGTLTGDAEEPLVFHVEGPVADFDPLGLLRSLRADATVGLGRLGLPPGLTTAGTVTVASADGRAQVSGGLSLNGGRLELDALLDANPADAGTAGAEGASGAAGAGPVSTLRLTLDGVQLNQELATLLAHVHPLFAGGGDAELATVTGRLAGGLDARWAGPLPAAGEGATDWLALLGRSLSATGRLQGDGLALTGSPLLADMLGRVGVPSSKDLSIAPVEFAVRDGRLAYAEPWLWRVSGIETSFTGSLGLDLSLDLTWHVPVTERLVQKHGFLESLAGQTISIPITGSVSAPRLEWDGALKGLAERAAKAELERKAKEKLGGLGGILGEGGKAGEGEGGKAATPEELLASADRLWDEGQRQQARALYREILDKHKLSLVYALNKKRIKDRAGD